MQSSPPKSEGELQRGFGLSTATYVVIASMVGSGILVSPGYMMASLGNAFVILGLWVLGGALAMCGALCVSELAAAIPRAGGEYVYMREAYGRMPAFLSGWTSFVIGMSAPLAVVSHLAAVYIMAPFLSGEDVATGSYVVKIVATVILIAVTAPNLLGYRQSASAQNLTTVLKLVLFGALVLVGFTWGNGSFKHFLEGRSFGEVEIGVAASQLFFVMFAYSGWNAATYLAGEVKAPSRTLPMALILGTAIVTLLYLTVNCVFAYAVPLSSITPANAELLPRLAAERLFGPRISNAFSIAVGLTFLATVNAFVVTGPRIYYAMAKDGLFPAWAGRVGRRSGVPASATVAQSICAFVILFATDFENLYKYASVGLSLFTMLYVGAVIILRRRRPDLERPFRVPGYPYVPVLYMAVTAFTAVFAFKLWPGPSLFSLGSILAGIPIYYAWLWLRPSKQSEPRP